MATIEKKINKNGEVSYLVKVRMLGFEDATEKFASQNEAKCWADDIDPNIYDKRHFCGPAWISDPFRRRL